MNNAKLLEAVLFHTECLGRLQVYPTDTESGAYAEQYQLVMTLKKDLYRRLEEWLSH